MISIPGSSKKNNALTNQKEQQAPQDVIYNNGTAQQKLQQYQYEAGKTDTGTLAAATGMTYMPFTRQLGSESLNQTSLLRKDFKIRGVIGNAGQKDRLSFVSLSHQINNGRTAGYSEKEIVAGRYIPLKAGGSVMTYVLIKVGKPNQGSGKQKERRVTFVKRHASNRKKIRSRRTAAVKELISCFLRHMNIYSVF